MTADELELMLQPPNERPAAKPRVTIPTRDKFTSLIGLGPMPVTKIFATQGLVDGVYYQLTSCDYLGFGPVAVRGLDRA